MRSERRSCEELSQRGRVRSAVPYGGDAAVARSMLVVHVRNPWTGRCRSCREIYPRPDRRDAEAVLGHQPEGPGGLVLLALALGAGLTIAVVGVAVLASAGLVRW